MRKQEGKANSSYYSMHCMTIMITSSTLRITVKNTFFGLCNGKMSVYFMLLKTAVHNVYLHCTYIMLNKYAAIKKHRVTIIFTPT